MLGRTPPIVVLLLIFNITTSSPVTEEEAPNGQEEHPDESGDQPDVGDWEVLGAESFELLEQWLWMLWLKKVT